MTFFELPNESKVLEITKVKTMLGVLLSKIGTLIHNSMEYVYAYSYLINIDQDTAQEIHLVPYWVNQVMEIFSGLEMLNALMNL